MREVDVHDHDPQLETVAQPPPGRRSRSPEQAGPVGQAVRARRLDALGTPGLTHLQREVGNAGVSSLVDHEDESPVKDVVAGGGTALDEGTRHDMESHLGQDFSGVRIHTDAAAASSAVSVQARAYTVGDHIVFGDGQYRPETSEGRRTLAHELTHVVQQRQGPVDGTPAAGGIRVSDPGDPFERQASAAGDAVAASPPVVQTHGPEGAPAVQREALGADEDAGDEPSVQRSPDAPSEQVEEPTDEDVPPPA